MKAEDDFRERFLHVLPQLLEDAAFRTSVLDELGEDGQAILDQVQNKIQLDVETEDLLYDAASNSFSCSAKCVLTLGWDGDAPGMSGAIYVNSNGGAYTIESGDDDPSGPFSSLAEALQEECFDVSMASPEVDSDIFTLPNLLGIARPIVNWEDRETVSVNGYQYKVCGEELVRIDES